MTRGERLYESWRVAFGIWPKDGWEMQGEDARRRWERAAKRLPPEASTGESESGEGVTRRTMTTHDGADAETKVEAMGDEELRYVRRMMALERLSGDDDGLCVDEARRLLARLDAEAARAKAAEAQRDGLLKSMSRILLLASQHLYRNGQTMTIESIARAALNVKGG